MNSCFGSCKGCVLPSGTQSSQNLCHYLSSPGTIKEVIWWDLKWVITNVAFCFSVCRHPPAYEGFPWPQRSGSWTRIRQSSQLSNGQFSVYSSETFPKYVCQKEKWAFVSLNTKCLYFIQILTVHSLCSKVCMFFYRNL